ncbi:armadillo repeat-containing X-linked protein 1 isoform X1 [Herpailurus yagouaroundi]|uniref:armadillo repeat-containing X-linked protein 1 isoform X1 n=1 Tax=Herpailurus yagouaroundi TaxID=1608482 RepID=UPI001AD738C5|nr:armadillo repeat-containing X-linked protein 1 isoform X1 [Puma yagouaroundi]XP_040323196.1 armadillo repeat-containing X-linked protein 1 isoform X1 [Puma yagouaroundi]XP_040323197.1 armadillo repeat-containing X-linked protein 1 isoform X1 [Puma yagouaroundi]XP_040323198.1 armadillo repeat-containing X-linked protein 1 isoform X1 [Puma yagouaroundi]XP_040323199.1 armadillo repeat-containing X-linked protein 1 isoform X1 [Puma yagouaroundi]XP_040323200.1 armadillo repeat-containing X-linke
MGRTREAGCVAAGVVIGAGACYCVYRLTWGRDENEKIWDDDDEDDEEESSDIVETRIENGKGAKANAGMGSEARLQGDAKVKAEVGMVLESGSDVKAEVHLGPQSGGGLEAKAKALFSTLKEQASAKAGRGARLGTISGNRTLAPSLPCPGGRGGGCHPTRSGARAGSRASGKTKGRTRGKSTRTPATAWPVRRGKFNFPYKIDDILGAPDLQKVLNILERSNDPFIQEIALVTLGNNAAYSFNQNAIRELGGLPIIAKLIKTKDLIIREKAYNALNNLSVNAENQGKIKTYISQVCDDTMICRLDSAVQMAGLRLLTNMTVTNHYQHLLSYSFPDFFALLFLGNYFTKIQIMKLIINFTENPAMTRELVSCKVPSELISLFNKEWDREILLNILTLFENINDNIKSEGLASSKKEFSRSSLFFLFKESGVCIKKIKALANHNDLVVKVKVLKVLTKL